MPTHATSYRAILVAGLATALLGTAAQAQDRQNLSALTCEAARSLVARDGAVVFSTGPNGYDRVVRDAGQCGIDEMTAPDYQRSADQQRCFVGYRCKQDNRGDNTSE